MNKLTLSVSSKKILKDMPLFHRNNLNPPPLPAPTHRPLRESVSCIPGREESFDFTTNSNSLSSLFVSFVGGLSDVLLCKWQ